MTIQEYVDNILLQNKKNEQDSLYSIKLERRKVSDEMIDELKSKLKEDNMNLKQVRIFLVMRDIKVNNNYTYIMSRRINGVSYKKEELLEDDRYEVIDDILLDYYHETEKYFNNNIINSFFFYNLDEIRCDVSVNTRK